MTAGPTEAVVVAILAGGTARRLGGGDKTLLMLGDGRPILAHILARLNSSAAVPVVLSANGDPARFAAFGLPVVPDAVREADGTAAGPLSGLAAVMDWVRCTAPSVRWVVTVPGDVPFVPSDLVGHLVAACRRDGAEGAVAMSAGRVHHATALWPMDRAAALSRALRGDGLRRVETWAAGLTLARAEWTIPPGGPDPFFNINTPEDLAGARRLSAGAGA